MPSISILTPVWNGLPLIKSCVESVLSQSFEDWEYIISDNGSTDGTRDYLATLTDPRIRVIYQPQNLGILRNVNFLIQQARAPISQFVCADDYLAEPGSLGRILELWSSASAEVGFIRANWNLKNARGTLEAYSLKVLPKLIEPRDSDLYFFLFGCIPGNISNISIRTPLVEEVGWFEPRLFTVGDFEFWSRAARHRAFLLESADITCVRSHSGQASKYLNNHGEAISQLYEIVEDLFDRIKPQFSLPLLKLHATVGYDALQRWAAVHRLLRERKGTYLDELTVQTANRHMFVGSAMRWMTFLMSGGGRWGRTLVARHLLTHRALGNSEASQYGSATSL